MSTKNGVCPGGVLNRWSGQEHRMSAKRIPKYIRGVFEPMILRVNLRCSRTLTVNRKGLWVYPLLALIESLQPTEHKSKNKLI